MPTILTTDYVNVVGTGAINSDRRIVQMEDKIWMLEPSKAPLITFLSRLKKQSVGGPEFKWLEEERTPTEDRINNGAGYTAGATSIVVDNGAYFPVNCMVRVQRTGEVMHVTAVSTNTLTVVRSFTTTAAAALVDNDQLTVVGGAAIEGGTAETSRSVQTATVNNYIQIFTDPFGVSDVARASDLYGGADLPHRAMARGIEHAVYVNKAFLFGEKAENTGGTGGRWTTGGADEFISTNRTAMGGTIADLTGLYTHAQDVFRYGKKNKLMLASRGVVSNISLLAAGRLETVPADKTYGIHVERLQTPHGVWMVVNDDLLEGDAYGGYAFTLDMNSLQYMYLQRKDDAGGDTHIVTNIQANNARFRKDEWRTYAGLRLHLEKAHGVLTDAA